MTQETEREAFEKRVLAALMAGVKRGDDSIRDFASIAASEYYTFTRARVGKGEVERFNKLAKVVMHMADRLEHYGEKFDEAEYDALIAAQAKPVEVGELAEMITIALPKTPSDKSIGLHVAQAILNKYNVTEK